MPRRFSWLHLGWILQFQASRRSSWSSELFEDVLGRRILKARALLAAVGKFPDAQGAFCMLRSCSGWSKILYSCRIVPADAQLRGLRTADSDVRSALCHLIGRSLSDDDWRLASLGIAAGGLGARSAAEHAPSAYVASFSACRELCGLLWTDFDPLDLDDGCHLAAAESSLPSVIPSGANTHSESDSPWQKSLSCKIEARSVSGIFAAIPIFRTALQRRLRMPLWDHDSACSMCGEVLDRWGGPCPLLQLRRRQGSASQRHS